MAVGQNQWYNFYVGAPPNLVFLSGDWDGVRDFDSWPYDLSRSSGLGLVLGCPAFH